MSSALELAGDRFLVSPNEFLDAISERPSSWR
jgi:hypothetical protein